MKAEYREALDALKKALISEFGSHSVADVIFFGSVARETDTVASDIDVMIILDMVDKSVDWYTEKRIRSVAFDVELAYDVVFDLKVLDRKLLHRREGHTPFVEKALAEGISV